MKKRSEPGPICARIRGEEVHRRRRGPRLETGRRKPGGVILEISENGDGTRAAAGRGEPIAWDQADEAHAQGDPGGQE